jgi:putative aldouronate transport system substrate-binding protein
LTLISKNCKYPERAIAFMDYMMSEHGQMLIYLGVEGVTYDIVDGKPVLKEDVSKILNSDRETYDRLYGADDAYWMLQNNVMQLQWEQKAGPATEQLLVWACKYTVYNGQYDVSLSTSPEIAAMDEKCTKLWSETLPKLLLASNEAQFDEIFEEFVGKRNAMGYQEVLKQKTVLMNAAKEKMGISE